jgi:hypothetical protein
MSQILKVGDSSSGSGLIIVRSMARFEHVEIGRTPNRGRFKGEAQLTIFPPCSNVISIVKFTWQMYYINADERKFRITP